MNVLLQLVVGALVGILVGITGTGGAFCDTGTDLCVSNGTAAGAGYRPDDLVAADLVHRIHPIRASAPLRSSTWIADSSRHLCRQLLRGELGSASSTSAVTASAGQRSRFGRGALFFIEDNGAAKNAGRPQRSLRNSSVCYAASDFCGLSWPRTMFCNQSTKAL